METDKSDREPMKCDLPPREALRRAMLVQPPDKWKRARRKARKESERKQS